MKSCNFEYKNMKKAVFFAKKSKFKQILQNTVVLMFKSIHKLQLTAAGFA